MNHRAPSDALILDAAKVVELAERVDQKKRNRLLFRLAREVLRSDEVIASMGYQIMMLENHLKSARASADHWQNRAVTHTSQPTHDICEHDPILQRDIDLPEYCWFYRCRKCGVEYSDPAELEPQSQAKDDAGSHVSHTPLALNRLLKAAHEIRLDFAEQPPEVQEQWIHLPEFRAALDALTPK